VAVEPAVVASRTVAAEVAVAEVASA
jgi:hypothetical protein